MVLNPSCNISQSKHNFNTKSFHSPRYSSIVHQLFNISDFNSLNKLQNTPPFRGIYEQAVLMWWGALLDFYKLLVINLYIRRSFRNDFHGRNSYRSKHRLRNFENHNLFNHLWIRSALTFTLGHLFLLHNDHSAWSEKLPRVLHGNLLSSVTGGKQARCNDQ